MASNDDLGDVLRAIFGHHWLMQASRRLGVDERKVRYLVMGRDPIEPWLLARLDELLAEKTAELTQASLLLSRLRS